MFRQRTVRMFIVPSRRVRKKLLLEALTSLLGNKFNHILEAFLPKQSSKQKQQRMDEARR